MATLYQIHQIFAPDLGGETLRLPNAERSVASVTVKHDRTATVSGHATPGTNTVTLWDSSVDNPSTFDWHAVVADPDDAVSTTAHRVDIRVTSNSQTHIIRIDRNRPYIAGPSAQTTGAITKIEALNVETASADVVVRMVAVD